MQIGDMPDFDDAMNVALNGSPGQPGLAQDDARQKHLIIISDGDPAPPSAAVMAQYLAAQVSVSTVSVFPHELPLPKTMVNIAQQTGGRAYGPIESNPSQLPQIFVKEATVVRRSLISEDKDGIEVKNSGGGGGLDLLRGIAVDQLPKVYGLVLTSRKENPQVETPLVAGKNNDPLLAYWQVGLGQGRGVHERRAQQVGRELGRQHDVRQVLGAARPRRQQGRGKRRLRDTRERRRRPRQDHRRGRRPEHGLPQLPQHPRQRRRAGHEADRRAAAAGPPGRLRVGFPRGRRR